MVLVPFKLFTPAMLTIKDANLGCVYNIPSAGLLYGIVGTYNDHVVRQAVNVMHKGT